jgi:hypothetical protein
MAETSDTFPIYTDPSGRIYQSLRMKRTLTGITAPAEYTKESLVSGFMKTMRQMFQSGFEALKGGPWNQNGGEWIFRGGRVQYVHKMKHVSDHLTAEQLLNILKLDEKPRDGIQEI